MLIIYLYALFYMPINMRLTHKGYNKNV